ncbi:hypothetical protein BH24PSE2_BH24PSE2_07330 [soil metagenome]
MPWTVIYHPDVRDDLRSLGRTDSRRAVHAIHKRIRHGEPDKVGRALRKDLTGCRRLRVGDMRIVYSIDATAREAVILAIGRRRNEEAYRRAGRRTTRR